MLGLHLSAPRPARRIPPAGSPPRQGAESMEASASLSFRGQGWCLQRQWVGTQGVWGASVVEGGESGRPQGWPGQCGFMDEPPRGSSSPARLVGGAWGWQEAGGHGRVHAASLLPLLAQGPASSSPHVAALHSPACPTWMPCTCPCARVPCLALPATLLCLKCPIELLTQSHPAPPHCLLRPLPRPHAMPVPSCPVPSSSKVLGGGLPRGDHYLLTLVSSRPSVAPVVG